MKHIFWAILGGIYIFFPMWAGAVGFRMPNQDPEAIARGNAFVATADNPSAIYYNPAGITQLDGHHVSVGGYFITTGMDFTAPDGRTASPDSGFQTVPQLYYVFSPEASRWSYGLGLYAPYGLGVDWGSDTPFSTKAEKAQLVYASLSPVLAYQVSDSLSVAASLTINYSEVEVEQAIPGFLGGGKFRYEGDDLTFGYTLGLLYQPHEQWSFGLSYRSRDRVDFKGDSRVGSPGFYQSTDASLKFPDTIDLGVSYRPTSDWNFEFGVDWTNWDQVNVSTFEGTLLGDLDLSFNYDSGFVYKFGVTRQLGNGYWVSAGYSFSENSVPDRTLSPLNPDADLHLGSLGVGHRGEAWSWALAYHFAYNGGRTVKDNALTLGGESANGEFEIFNQAVNVSFQFKF